MNMATRHGTEEAKRKVIPFHWLTLRPARGLACRCWPSSLNK
ncbi:hypothetical protein E2C01_091372 [Portunus trituberculatus]|uniref:Uncharacterized protein n=1 Tax=Portunus trituberculatus TaxID=210409 RepID=A0A5B7JHB4_PORTR|nr:hypothetical protein [Portunus trituberculatus]